MKTYTKIYLKTGKEDSLKRFHPWIFSGAIHRFEQQPEEGDVVEVCDSTGHFLAIGHYQIGSIAVRILSFTPVQIDEAFFVQRLRSAYVMRQSLCLITPENNTYRLVHGEGDNLSGLIIDIYGETAVLQAHSPV